jgi:hypothetical protein
MGGHLWTDVKWNKHRTWDVKWNGDTRRTEQRCMANGTKHNQWRRHCKAVRVCELSNDGMQKRKENFFFFYFILLLLLFSSYFSSKTTTKVTHYMIASSKTHRNA